MKINERLIVAFDWLWLLALLCLTGAGLIVIQSTTDGTGLNSYFGRQLIGICIGFLLFLVIIYFDYHIFSDYISFVYIAGLGILGLVLIIGRAVHNNKSWLDIGTYSFQPSEIVKVLVIIALAKYYSESDRDHLELNELLMGGLMVFGPMLLVIFQGDLGTAITFLPIYIVLSLIAGIKRRYIIAILLILAVAAPITWMMLRGYQKGRIETVLNPTSDPYRLGYQTIQSEIAIGSGRFLGKGFKQGSQGQMGFLPARHTDFVFAVFSEEQGFVGSIALLSLFMFISLRMLRTARESKDKLGLMIVVGVLSLFLFHIIINIGMVVGLLPIAGIPLPFISAGGSSMISFLVAMGLCMNVRMRRYVN